MFKRFLLRSILVAVFVASLPVQSAVAQEYLVDKVITLTAPTGGVVKDSPYVIQNHFVVALETKAQTLPFAALYKDAVVTLPYYQGTVYKGQHAHWWESAAVVTDYEGAEIGFFVEDCVPTDLICDVLLIGTPYDGQFRPVTPLVNGLPVEVSATMGAGSGTGTLTVPDWAAAFELELTTDGNWNTNGTITITITRTGTSTAEVWASKARGVPPRVLRESNVTVGTNTLTLVLVNTSGATVSSGSRITRSLVWMIGKREL